MGKIYMDKWKVNTTGIVCFHVFHAVKYNEQKISLEQMIINKIFSVFDEAHQGSTAGFHLLQHFSVGHAVVYSSCLISMLKL